MDVLLFIKAFIISIIEGITEFLPISSTGYMVLSADIINFWDKDKRDLFIVFVQIGAILAVIYDYWGRLWTAFMGLITGRADGMTNPRRLGISLIITTIPVMIVGLTLEDFITGTLFHPLVVATMLIIGALLIIYVEKHPRPIKAQEAEQINFKTALKIGLCQCLALIPGTSRSGATIIGALWFGVSRKAATEFSFFLGIPVIIGAGLLELIDKKDLLQTGQDWAVLGVGTLVSFVVALLCIRLLVAWVSTKDFMVFAYLRIITGVIVLLAYFVLGYQIKG
ncbi:undecaprenyl-diphosphate phosphatase [Moraxella nonliquefaciens]|uniref:Undecaprenyl-diphosphatase n=1 Tax=Moraxella nonliquefaciens TaxID=478 RepID=A0A1B8QJ26_MORNO|nr:undecaprenyl-diphosphate phosphatase [Moraxella nonliquefaciens]OBX49235.1 undecaprenyl-diphosphatase [Moraxella nonliquefaciens]OBX83472.1 undecaprenyl-diphosphatase [Moraxella nonliquefaciens]QPT43992.1 undecaprenyl-diphosphate phosphatase [Moraxella nonliquefaciens]QQC29012.1 undecaprenyl-diphosphate phosphatase [Moraxella nonliquefaciens]